MDIGMIVLAIGVALIGEYKDIPLFKLGSVPLFLAVGFSQDNGLITFGMIAVAVIQFVRAFSFDNGGE